MQKVWSALVLVGAVVYAQGAAAQDPEEKRIPFQAEVTFNFKAIPLNTGDTGIVEVASVPANTRLVITEFSARCQTATSTPSLGPLALSVTAPVFFGTADESRVTHWFPAVVQGNNSFVGVGGTTGPIYSPVTLWAASSTTHMYAGAGTKVTVQCPLGGYADIITKPYVVPPSCHATITGYLVFPS